MTTPYDSPWKEISDNPFATVAMAYLKALDANCDKQARYHWKLSLIKRLYERNYSRRDV